MKTAMVFLAAAALSMPPVAQTPSIALTSVSVIDGSGTPPRNGMTVLIQGERIADVFPAGAKPLPSGAVVRDLPGHTVIPGLIDAHVHLLQLETPERMRTELRRMLRAGIVGVREMAGAQATRAIRERVRAGEIEGPDIYSSFVIAGPSFMTNDPRTRADRAGRAGEAGRSGRGADLASGRVASEADVPAAILRAVETGASAVKLYAELSPIIMARASAVARERGLRVWAHATMYPSRPMETVRAGVDGVSHACGLAWEDRDLDPSPYERVNLTSRPRFDPALVDADGPEITALVAAMAARGVVLDPTLAVHARPNDDEFGCTTEVAVSLTRAAKRAGVTLLAGTDFHAPEDAPLPSLYQEIEMLVASGVLTPLEAVAAATSHPARAMGLDRSLGTVAAGREASLVVLKADPSKDIRAIREVALVFRRGRQIR